MRVMVRPRLRIPQIVPAYLTTVGIVGLFLALHGVVSVFGTPRPFSLILLVLLIVTTTITSTSLNLNGNVGITYHIDSAIALSAIPFYGPTAAALLIVISSFTLWLIKPTNRSTWKKTRIQLLFNIGMMSISCATAGVIFNLTQTLLSTYPLLAATLPWIITAITFEFTNGLLLSIILRLQNGKYFNPFNTWKNAVVTTTLNLVINTVGAAFLAYAVTQLGWIGILVFFLPVITSAYAFHSYVKGVETHMANLEQIVDERTKALQHMNKEKSLFLAVLAHDMKSPLTSINLYGQMLQRKPYLAADKPRIVESILDSQQNLLELVNNILDLENLEEGNGMILDCKQFDLTETLDLLADRMDAQASSKSIGLTFTHANSFLPIYGDRSQIRRVFANLVSNAIKYTPQNGSVFVEAQQNNTHITITVRDTGYGIPADAIDTIFDRYSRVEKHRDKAVGTGLGLSITKAIVEAHDGTITVESEENVGTTFTVILPINSA